MEKSIELENLECSIMAVRYQGKVVAYVRPYGADWVIHLPTPAGAINWGRIIAVISDAAVERIADALIAKGVI